MQPADRVASPFRPETSPCRLVQPEDAFQPSSGGGYGVASMTGNRHDVVAKSAPEWFRILVVALSAAKGSTKIAARCIGSAGKYRFWDLPAGVTTAAQLEAMTAPMVAEVAARHAAEEVNKLTQAVSSLRARHEAAAASVNGIVIDFACRPDGLEGDSTVLADDGREFAVTTREDAQFMGFGRRYETSIKEIA